MKKNQGGKFFSLSTIILTKVELKLINYIALPNRAENNSRFYSIRLCDVHFGNYAHD